MLSRQTKATEGVRNLRLDAWFHIRRLREADLFAVLHAGEYSLKPALREAMSQQAVYHVVVRGNDPRFMPPGDSAGTDVVTTYFCENVQSVYDEVDRYLFDELGNPSGIKEAMDDPLFCGLLEAHYNSGDVNRDETLHLAGRLRGGSNLLHTCIKEGCLDTLRLLLDRFTRESQENAPWRVLAEPLRPVGKFRISAFHRAVYDGRASCLGELLAWADRHGHDITMLLNAEERFVGNEPVKQLTCLQLAEQEGNMECYNLLAAHFGVGELSSGVDQQTREERHAAMGRPRLEISLSTTRQGPLSIMKSVDLPEPTWSQVIESMRTVLSSLIDGAIVNLDESGTLLHIKLDHVEFVDDASDEEACTFLDIAADVGCDTLAMDFCVVRTDRTLVAILGALVCRLQRSLKDARVPTRVNVSSAPAQPLSPEDEVACDMEAATLLDKLVSRMGHRPDFLGARNGVISREQKHRLARFGGTNAWPAAWAAVYGSRIAKFVAFVKEEEEGIEVWLRRQQLLPVARVIFDIFYSREALLQKEFLDPREALDSRVCVFLKMVLESWFALACDEENAWHEWGIRLGTDDEVMQVHLAPALDLVLETLLRMDNILDHACSKQGGLKSFASILRSAVPCALLGRLPYTKQALGERSDSVPQPARVRSSLLTSTTSLRPAWTN